MAASNELEALRRSFVKEIPRNGHQHHPEKFEPNGDIRENGENIPPSANSHAPRPAKSQPKCENFIMTGELIIKTKSSNATPKNHFRPRDDSRLNPAVTVTSNLSNGDKEEAPRLSVTEVRSPERKGGLSYGGNFVRTSRSEDFLQKGPQATSGEADEEVATSLDNLLDAATSPTLDPPQTTPSDCRTGQFVHVQRDMQAAARQQQQRYSARAVRPKRDGVTTILIDENKICVKVPPEQTTEDEPRRCCSPEDESDAESVSSFHYSPKAVDMPSASRLAKRLFHLEGFRKSDVSRHLCKNNDFSRVVAEEYLKFFEFGGASLDAALRDFLRRFCLIGETQERERVLVHFSRRFLECNEGAFKSQGEEDKEIPNKHKGDRPIEKHAVHTLTCALMLLNTDLHGENVGRRMTCAEFIENLSELNEGENFSKDVLKALYHSIKTAPLEWAVEEEEESVPNDEQPHQPEQRQSFIGHNPFLEVPNPNFATEYKKGYVMRKCCVDPNGKKTPIGKRGWKMFYADLRDLVLYLHKDENGFRKNQLYDSLHHSIRIHHALATRAADYTKKQHVFRLQTADQAAYLFQTSDSKELQSWIDTINYVAACLSAPSLASAVGAQRKFQRPLLPVAPTKLNFREQLLEIESRVLRLEKEIEEHLSRPPERSAKARVVGEFVEKEHFLQYELRRYRAYNYLLRSKIAQFPELEPPLVETSIGEVDEGLERNDHAAAPPPAFSNAPAKRSLSDRFSYRAAIYKTSDEGA